MIDISPLSTGSMLIILVSISLPTLLLIISAAHHRRVKKYLLENIPADETTCREAAKILGVESVTAVGVSLFDVLYNTARLDPFVLKGIEHLHHAQHFENLGDLISFMKSKIIDSESGTYAWRQMIHKYKGYTGEEQAINKIRESGANVTIPESGTNPDFDAIVKGQQVDFAITDNPSYVQAKLDSDPNVLVWTNREMANHFADNPRVYVDHDLSAQNAFHTTQDSISGISDLGDFMDRIPHITFAISATKNLVGVVRGNKGVGTAIEHTVLDTAGVGVGGFFGAKVGLGIGLAFAPVTGGASMVVIPAITTVVGSFIGMCTGKGITNRFKSRHLRSAVQGRTIVLEHLQQIFVQRFEELTTDIRTFYTHKNQRCEFALKETNGWFRRVFFPSPLAKFYSMAMTRLSEDWQKTHDFYRELKQKISAVEPKKGGFILFAQGSSILNGNPALLAAYQDVERAFIQVKTEERKLK